MPNDVVKQIKNRNVLYDIEDSNTKRLLESKQDSLTPGSGIELDPDGTIAVVSDSELSSTSENSVQNKVVKAAIDEKANNSDLESLQETVDNLADVASSGSYTDLSNKPTKLSEFSNDQSFIDNTVNNLTNYYNKSSTYSKDEIDQKIAAVSSLKIEIVTTLPQENPRTDTIYLVRNDKTQGTDLYDEYIYVDNHFEHIGTTAVDLSNYYTKSEVDNLLNSKEDSITVLPMSKGGTGASTAMVAQYNLFSAINEVETDINENTLFTFHYANPSTSIGSFYKRKASKVLSYFKNNISASDIGAAATSHTHTKSQITDFSHTHTKSEITDFSHTHGNITNAGAIGTTANLPLITTTSGKITTGSFGTAANTFCQGNDSRLSNSRDPNNHASNKVTSMTGYTKGTAIAAISTSDSLNTAIGKLEYIVGNSVNGSQTSTSAADSGSNVFTFTFPDGTTKTFTVKNGSKGSTGSAPNLSIGTVTTGAAGTDASATITGTNPNYKLNLTIPRGYTGDEAYTFSTGDTNGTIGVTPDGGTKQNIAVRGLGSFAYKSSILASDVPTLNQNTTGSAATLTTARTLTIGSTGKTFNGSANVSWTLAEIGAAAASHTHSYLPLAGGTMTGSIILPDGKHIIEGTSGSSYALLGCNGTIQYVSTPRMQTYVRSSADNLYHYRGDKSTVYKILDTANGVTLDTTQTITGTKTFSTADGFTYSGIGTGTSDSFRNVWFSYDGVNGRPVYDTDFQYNPAKKSIKLKGCNISFNDTTKSLDFTFA